MERWIIELSKETDFETNSLAFVVFGTIILFVSWLFFNGASTFSMYNARESGISKIMMVTILSGCTGGICATFIKPIIMGTFGAHNRYDVGALTNGILSGLVAITGICDRVEPWAAFVIGALSSLVYGFSCKLLQKLDIDDPIEASPVHGFNGLWGLIAVGLFDNQYGLFYGQEGCGSYFLWQLLGGLVIIVWVFVTSATYFIILKKLNMLRVPLLDELLGLDIVEHGSNALKFEARLKEGFLKAVAE